MTFNDATLQEATLRRWDREVKGKTPAREIKNLHKHYVDAG